MKPRIQQLPTNDRGRDFVMGDLHGELHLLMQKLHEQQFDPEVDRLFSVGDLVDRGTDSLGALRLLREPWFHAVGGNHEQMMVDYVLRHVGGQRWHDNGGRWHKQVNREELVSLAKLAKELPMMLIVGDDPQTQFRVVHAEWPFPSEQLQRDPDGTAEANALWSRTLHLQYQAFCNANQLSEPYAQLLTPDDIDGRDLASPYVPIQPGIGLTFCGHTSVRRPGLWRSHFLLDTGAGWWESAALTVLKVSGPLGIYRYWQALGAGVGDIYE